MTRITSPIEGFTGKTSFGPITVDFKDGVADADIHPGSGVAQYLADRGYGVDASQAGTPEDAPKDAPKEDQLAPAPDGSWTVADLTAYAKENEISLPADAKKAAVLEAIEAHTAANAAAAPAPAE